MKRRIIVFILSLLLLAINPDVFAQKAKPKGGGTKSGGGAKAGGTKSGGGAKAGGAKSGTTKGKKGKKGKGEPAVADTTSTVAPPPVAETNNGPAEDTGFATPENLIAASDSFDFGKVDLDTAKPFTGYVASNLNLLKGAKPFPFPQEDIHSIKPFIRIWRDIYTTDSENRVFSMPGNTLIDFLIKGIKAGKIAAYEDETFRKKMTYAKIMKKLRDSSLIN
ncbi:MAG: hypothetical protein EBX41_07325, partial [Chitinophagia bacterium]|nr:hypothetical protein [Chitinophagia bacterium]